MIEEVKLTKYKCPFCGKLYDTDKEAEQCHIKHLHQIHDFQSIKGKWYKSVYDDYEGPSIIHLYKFLELTPEGIVYLKIDDDDSICKYVKQIDRPVKDLFEKITKLSYVDAECADKEYIDRRLNKITVKVHNMNILLEEAKQ